MCCWYYYTQLNHRVSPEVSSTFTTATAITGTTTAAASAMSSAQNSSTDVSIENATVTTTATADSSTVSATSEISLSERASERMLLGLCQLQRELTVLTATLHAISSTATTKNTPVPFLSYKRYAA
jgi:hypothetical protein